MKKQNNTRRVCKKNIMIKQVTIKKKNDLNEKKVVQSEKNGFQRNKYTGRRKLI